MRRAAGPAHLTARLLGPADIRDLARRLQLRPSKRRGQTFVVDPNTVRRIVRTAALRPGEVVLEVGPGLGSLTLGLLEVASRVVAVEVDPRLAAALPDTVRARAPDLADRLTVVRADAIALSDLPEPSPTALVANLPYNVAVPVLLHVLEALPSVQRGLVMVQAEVADRLAASPGTAAYGSPTVKAAWYAAVRPAGRVAPTVFWPVPNVESGLVSWVRRPAPDVEVPRERVFGVVDAAFAQRRKTLRSALAGLAGSPTAAEAALRVAGVSPQARGEQLDVVAFAHVATALGAVRH